MRLLLLGVIMLLGCAPSFSRAHVESVDVASAPARASLQVHGGTQAGARDEWAAFLPVELDESGPDGWGVEALRSAGYRISVVEFEDIVGSTPHKLLTREFRREWSYDRGEPTPQDLQGILLKIYSQYPIPQLIGTTP